MRNRFLPVPFLLALFSACAWADLSSSPGLPGVPEAENFAASVGGPDLPGGGRIACELPGEFHRRNTESKGLGLCVFTSIHHSAVWQNIPQLQEFPLWLRQKGIAGGGWPDKVRQLIAQLCQEKGVPIPPYIQIEDADLEILKVACKTGRMPAVTYGLSPTRRYSGQPINHMVSLVHADNRTFTVLDNNYPGERAYEHQTPAEFLRAYCTVAQGGRAVNTGKGWSVVFLGAPPPPRPVLLP